MTTAVHKYELRRVVEQVIAMPVGSRILCVQLQRGDLQLWVRVPFSTDGNLWMEERRITIVGTGEAIEGAQVYVGTYQLDGRGLVFHVFTDSMEEQS